jgi:hypothetical protein
VCIPPILGGVKVQRVDLVVRILRVAAVIVSLGGVYAAVIDYSPHGTKVAGCGVAAAIILEWFKSERA